MTPKKKEEKIEKKSPKEHLFTKEELIADLGNNNNKTGFLGRFFSSDKKNEEVKKVASVAAPFGESISQPIQKKSQSFDIKSGSIKTMSDDISNGLNRKPKDAAVQVAGAPQIKEPISIKSPSFKHANAFNKKRASVDAIEDAVIVKNDKHVIELPIANEEKVIVENKIVIEDKKPEIVEIKKETVAPEKMTVIDVEKNDKRISGYNLDKHHQEILTGFMGAVHSGDQKQLRVAIEHIAELRSGDEFECENSSPLNVAIRKELFESISSILAYKNSREVGKIFQLIDMLNLEITKEDFSLLPEEVLKSPEMHESAIKYLMWCAKEYDESPAEFERRITCFMRAGIVTSLEIHESKDLQGMISRGIFEYVKNNIKNPIDVERKINQYALAGLADMNFLKSSDKIKDIIVGYIIDVIDKYQDRTEEVNKKIREYELVGITSLEQLRDNEKIARALDKIFTKHIRVNKDHPRKATVLIRKYFDIGLIGKDARDNYLRKI